MLCAHYPGEACAKYPRRHSQRRALGTPVRRVRITLAKRALSIPGAARAKEVAQASDWVYTHNTWDSWRPGEATDEVESMDARLRRASLTQAAADQARRSGSLVRLRLRLRQGVSTAGEVCRVACAAW